MRRASWCTWLAAVPLVVLGGVTRCTNTSAYRVPKPNASNATTLVYIDNLGGYDHIRPGRIPHPGRDVDAVFLTDAATRSHHAHTLSRWVDAGWLVLTVPLIEPTAGNASDGLLPVSARRLEAKRAKFELLPDAGWTTQLPRSLAAYAWVVSFDSNMYIDLSRLPAFLRHHDAAAAVLLDWRHWLPKTTAWQAMCHEMHSMIDGHMRSHLTSNASRAHARLWREWMTAVHSTRPAFPQHYIDASIIARNLRHAAYPLVDLAFRATFYSCHTIERDQFVLPYQLWVHGADSEVAVVRMSTLIEQLGHCKVGGHAQYHTGIPIGGRRHPEPVEE